MVSVLGIYKTFANDVYSIEINKRSVDKEKAKIIDYYDNLKSNDIFKQQNFEPKEDNSVKNMDEAKKRIFELESKLRELEARMPKKHPDVRFLNYQARKRILVCRIIS